VIGASFFRGTASILLICGGWEFVTSNELIDVRFVPRLSSVLASLVHELAGGALGGCVLSTVGTALVCLFMSAFLGVCTGVLLGVTPKFRSYCMPVVEVLRPVPSVAFIPVFVLILGISIKSILWIVTIGCFWPILLSSLYGVRQVDELLLDVANTLHLPRYNIITKIIFPASLPSIFGGLRIALAISLISTVTCEMVMGFHGLGGYILEKERSFLFSEMYSGILMLSFCGLLINRLFVYFEHKIIFWANEKWIV